MIVKILQQRRSCRSALDYSIEKLLRGKASIVGENLLDGTDYCSMCQTFERYEDNPAIHEKTRSLSFHLAFNPGESDGMDDTERCVACIRELMEGIGYGDQPYVIFRHNDIERQHFHVVSVKARKDGKIIDTSFTGLRILREVKRLSAKYGFSVGLPKEEKTAELLPASLPKRFECGGNVRHGIKGAFREALSYRFRSVHQFVCVLRSLGVEGKVLDNGEGKALYARGLDEAGHHTSRFYGLERNFGVNAMEMMEKRLAENRSESYETDPEDEEIGIAAKYCLERSGGERAFREMLRSIGIEAVVTRDDNGVIEMVTLVSEAYKRAVNAPTLGIPISLFQNKERTKAWKRRLPKVNHALTSEQRKELRGLLAEFEREQKDQQRVAGIRRRK